MATMPSVRLSEDSVRQLKDMEKWPHRIEKARSLFLLDVANFFKETLISIAPDVKIDGEDRNYAKDLRIAVLNHDRKSTTIALYLDGSQSVLTEKDLDTTVLYFRPTMNSPDWVQVLMMYGPWPANMVPVKLKRGDAKVIARRARGDEISIFAGRIDMDREEILNAFRNAGATDVKIEASKYAEGSYVHDDIGFNVLRREFGWDGQRQVAHWRPAFKKTDQYIKKSMNKMVKYVITGNESVFDLPKEVGRVDMETFKLGEGFAKEIAPFAPWKASRVQR